MIGPDDLLNADGDSLSALPGVTVADWSGLLAPGRERGSDLALPGRRGEVPTAKVLDAFQMDLPLTLSDEDVDGVEGLTLPERRAQLYDNLAALAAWVGRGPRVFTRVWPTGATTSVEHTATCRYVDGLGMSMLNPVTGRLVLSLRNLDGCWLSGSTVIVP